MGELRGDCLAGGNGALRLALLNLPLFLQLQELELTTEAARTIDIVLYYVIYQRHFL